MLFFLDVTLRWCSERVADVLLRSKKLKGCFFQCSCYLDRYFNVKPGNSVARSLSILFEKTLFLNILAICTIIFLVFPFVRLVFVII